MYGLMQTHALTIAKMLSHAEQNFARTEIVSRTGSGIVRYDYGEMAGRARRLASSLVRLGIQQGDMVGALAWTAYPLLEIVFAVPSTGAVLHTANPRSSVEQLRYTFGIADCRVLFIDTDLLALADEIGPILDDAEKIIALGRRGDAPATFRGRKLLWSEELIEAGDPDFAWPELDENFASGLCFTSGTTGKPKGVLYSHRANVLAALSISHNHGWGISAEDTILALPNFHHANGWGVPFFAAMLGAKLVLPGRAMDSRSLHELIVGEGVTVTGGVPTIFIKLVEYCKETGQDLGRLNRIFFGGSSQPHGFAGLIKRDYGITALNAWGMTETTIACTMKVLDPSPEAAAQPRQSQGRPIFGVEIRVVAEDGKPLPRDGKSQGRLQIRGPFISARYYRSDAPLAPDGWMETGDIAVISPDNELRIMDRDKDVIKSGGEWISSLELEAAALKFPGVRDAAAIGVPHPEWIERPILVIAGDEGVSAAAVRKHLEPLFPKFWLPDEVILVEALPYSASSGKLQKEVLRAQYRDRNSPVA